MPGKKKKPAPLNPVQRSAQAQINATLSQFGLGALAHWAWGKFLHGESIDQIMLDMRQTKVYEQRFPAMKALAAKGMALSEADYIAKERADMELLRSYGLPQPMWNNHHFLGNLIANEVSTTELQSRLDDYKNVVQQAPVEAREAFARYYGIGQGDLIAYFIDPKTAEPILHQKVLAAQIGGQAAVTGFGDLDRTTALRLAGLGVTAAQAQAGFSKAASMKQLTAQLPGDAANGSVTAGDLVGDTLVGDAASTDKVARATAARLGQFAGGGGFAASTAGVGGLGVSNPAD